MNLVQTWRASLGQATGLDYSGSALSRSPRPVLSGWVACFAFRGSVFIGRLLLGETLMRPLTSEGQR